MKAKVEQMQINNRVFCVPGMGTSGSNKLHDV